MKKILPLIISCIIGYFGYSQSGTIDTNFNAFSDPAHHIDLTGFNRDANEIIQLADGKILVAGQFTHFNNFRSNGIIRLLATGEVDTSFHSGLVEYSNVNTAVVQPDGKIIIGGNFLLYDGVPRSKIARINNNGSLDTSFNPGAGFNGDVTALALDTNNSILAGGNFTGYNGESAHYVARILTNGTIDLLFSPDFSTGNTYAINAIHVTPQGKILIGGEFEMVNNLTCSGLVQLTNTGATDVTFNITSQVNSLITSICPTSSGKYIITGSFYAKAIRINPSGTHDNTFGITIQHPQFDSQIINQAIELQNGEFLLVGKFIMPSGEVKPIGLTNADGSWDSNFIFNSDQDPQPFYSAIQLNNNEIAVTGSFNSIGKFGRNKIAAITLTGEVDSIFANTTGPDYNVLGAEILTNNKLVIVGSFQTYHNNLRNRIACLNPDGTLDTTSFNGAGADATILCVDSQNDGKILIGGNFKHYNGVNQQCIARLNPDGSIDTNFHAQIADSGSVHTVLSFAIQPDGKVLVAGYFLDPNGIANQTVVRLMPDGTYDNSFVAPIINNQVNALCLQPDGKILLAGMFSTCNGAVTNKISRLNTDGSLDQSFDPGGGFNSFVRFLDIQDDGKILASGPFTSFNGQQASGIIRLMLDGSRDNTFSPPVGILPGSFLIQPDHKILLVTNHPFFSQPDEVPLKRLNDSGSLDSTFLPVLFNDYISGIKLQPNGKILVFGSFTTANNAGRNRIARITNDLNYISDIEVYFSNIEEVFCNLIGEATANILGGTPPYIITWNPDSVVSEQTIFSTSGIYTVTASDAIGDSKSASLFISGPSSNGIDLTGHLLSSEFRPGHSSVVQLNSFNQSCNTTTGVISLQYDTLLSLQNATPTPQFIDGPIIQWNINDWNYDSLSFNIVLNFDVSPLAQINDSIELFYHIESVSNTESDTSDNSKLYIFPVVNGYDPNIKSAYPPGKCETHYIEQDQLITYTVQFQNTGNSEAINIYVVDSLDNDLDLQTLRVIGKSHDMWTEILPGNVLKFHFDNIHLPDSTNNEPESHGYVVYEVKPSSTWLGHNTEIHNTADIYFDFNPPIRTNTVTHMIYHGDIPLKDYNCDAAGLNQQEEYSEILVYPNPANELVTIRMAGNQKTYKATLIDLQGRQIADYTLSGEQIELSLGNLPNGIYLLTLADNTKVIKSCRINKIGQ